jgi:hypothetical protein
MQQWNGLLRCACWDCAAFRRQLRRRATGLVLAGALLGALATHALPAKALTALWPFSRSSPRVDDVAHLPKRGAPIEGRLTEERRGPGAATDQAIADLQGR